MATVSLFGSSRRSSITGNIGNNPGEGSKCPSCQRTIAVNHRTIACSSCKVWLHIKCGNVSVMQFQDISKLNDSSWLCETCIQSALPFSTITDDSLALLFTADTDHTITNTTPQVSSSPTTQLPAEWFNEHINGYYKNNLKIGHLNINSIYGKVDEVIDLLNLCRFDILFLSESKIDNNVSSSLFFHSEYRTIRRDRKKGAGGLLVFIRSTVTARRQYKLEPIDTESICLEVKGKDNTWFLVCCCYRSPSKCKIKNFISSCVNAAELMFILKSPMKS